MGAEQQPLYSQDDQGIGDNNTPKGNSTWIAGQSYKQKTKHKLQQHKQDTHKKQNHEAEPINSTTERISIKKKKTKPFMGVGEDIFNGF